MNYELAKELKEAGFHQGPISGDHHGNGTWFDSDGHEMAHESGDNDVYSPALHELIEACGEHFYEFLKSPDTTKHWSCIAWKDAVNDGTEKIVIHGSTPTEAVAKLWLALKKKS